MQFELGIVPTIINKNCKAEYIEALIRTRETENIEVFRAFMFGEHSRNIEKMIEEHKNSLNNDFDPINLITKKDDGLNITLRGDKILSIIKENPSVNVENIAQLLGISKPTAEREISTLKSSGFIERFGSKKNGIWQVKK